MNEEEIKELKSRVNKLTCRMTEEETNKLYREIIEYINEPIIEYINVNNPSFTIREFRKKFDYDELIRDNHKKQQEIERLNKGYCKFKEECGKYATCLRENQLKEIERLNNIIKELNYGIKELYDMFYETFRISQNGYYSISEWELKEFTDKLQELKERGKE